MVCDFCFCVCFFCWLDFPTTIKFCINWQRIILHSSNQSNVPHIHINNYRQKMFDMMLFVCSVSFVLVAMGILATIFCLFHEVSQGRKNHRLWALTQTENGIIREILAGHMTVGLWPPVTHALCSVQTHGILTMDLCDGSDHLVNRVIVCLSSWLRRAVSRRCCLDS